MNNIYKVIWSKAKNCYVVASEIARSHTKSASGSEKIGGVTRRSLLASLMALSLLCGGLGVAEATVHVNEGTGVTHEVYTTVETYSREVADAKLDLKADKTDVATNTANIATNADKITKLENDKLDKTLASETYATKDALNNKADKNYVDNAVAGAITTAGTNVDAKLEDYAKTTYVDTEVGKKANKATTLAGYGITDAYTKSDVHKRLNEKANKTDLTQAQTEIDGLNAKTTKITYDASNGTSVDGVTFNAGTVTGVTSINGTKIGTPEGGKYISQDGSIWGNMKKVDTQVETNEKNIETNKTAITNLDTKVGTVGTGTYLDPNKSIGENLGLLDTGLKQEVEDRIAADTALSDRIGTVTEDGNYIKESGTNNVSANLKVLDTRAKTNTDAIAKETADREAAIGELAVNGNYIEKDKNVSDNLVELDKQAKTNADAITKTNQRTAGITRDDTKKETSIEGRVTVDTNGNIKAEGTITSNGLDARAGEIKTTGKVSAGDVSTGTLETTGNAKIGGDLTVNGKLNVGEIYMEHKKQESTGKDYDSATAITADGISNRAKVTDENGNTTESKFTHNEKGTFNYAKDEKITGEWKGATSNVTADGVFNKMTDSDGNTHTYYQTATETKEQLVNGDKSNFEKKTAEGNTISIKDKDADGNKKSLTNKQTVDGEKTSVTNKDSSSTINQGADQIRNYVASTDGTKSSTEVKADGITNTSDGTITNDANHIENKANTMDTTVTGKATESYGELETTVNGKETHTVTGNQDIHVTGKQTNTVGGGQINNILTGNQETTVSDGSIINKAEHGDISNTAKNVTNEGTVSVTNKVGTNEVKVSKDGVDINVDADKTIKESVGADTSRTMTDGNIIDKAGDMTVTTNKTTGTTFENGTRNDTTVINGGTIGTNKVNANETNTKKLTAGAAADANGGRLTVDANDGVKGSYKSDKYTSKSYILPNTLTSGVDNGKEPIDADFVGSRTDHYMEGDKAKLDETVKDADGSNVTNKTSTGTVTTITDGTTITKTEQTDSMVQSYVGKKDGSATNVTTNFANASANMVTEDGKTSTVLNNKEGLLVRNTANGKSFNTADGTNTGTALEWTNVKGNEISTGKVEANYVKMDYADVMYNLGVRGNANIDGKTTTGSLEVKGESKLTGKVTMESDATVGGKLDVTGKATFSDDVDIKKNLSVVGDVTASSYKVGDKTYISAAGINANGQKITNVADGSISEGSKDAVNGGQLYTVKNDLEGKVNKVGANAAAMANLHPMEFDPDSKWNIAAAIGNYGSETAAALGAFYRPNDDVMVNLSTAFGTGENMVGGGVSVRLGKGGNKLSREESNALKDQVNDLTARMDALLSVLNPNMSKDFPDVPENHWAYEAVSRLAGNDIVQGYPDGEFHGDRTMTRYEMAEIIYNALSRGAEAERELVEEFKPELQAMAASEKATAERAEG